MKRFGSLLIIMCMMAVLAMGCGSADPAAPGTKAGEKVTFRISWQTSPAGDKVNLELLETFKKTHPNVEFVVETAESGKYPSKISMDIAANNIPDTFFYWRPEPSYGVDKFIQAGALADLSEIKNESFFKDKFAEYAVNTSTVDGKLYAIPTGYAFIMFLANKEIVEKLGLKIPETWEELVNLTNVAKAKGYIPWGVSTKPFASGWERPLGYVFDRFLTSRGENGVLNAFAGKAPFNSPEAIKAAEHLYDLVAGKSAPDSTTLDDTQATSKYFNTEKAVLYINGTYGLPTIKPELLDKLVPMKFPPIPGAADNNPIQDKDLTEVAYISSKAWADPVKKPILLDWIKFLCSQEFSDAKVYKNQTLTPNQDLKLDPTRVAKILIEAKSLADPANQVKWPLSFANPERKEPFYSVYSEFWAGKYTGKEFAQKLHEIFYQK
ncbi:ABC transporter substrate-binding protein [Paenibacillus sp. 1_12]|uniref:ABC transporter substrate-binding protein n=1 Tax=Paenibacillus sp. 1_12 TaxID=1566278 RepID=UPI00210BB6FC|nr:extracellular solute-binding protein [Paenibacillus sp. 1_12]